MRFQYAGPGPLEIRDLGGNAELVRPGDVREFTDYPPWGPWELLDGPDAEAAPTEEPPAGDPPPPATAAFGQPPVTPKEF